MLEITLLDEHSPIFPDPALALEDPNGLLAVGGNLETDTLLQAYRHGIFPWFSEGEPLLWWSPEPRCVIYPQHFHASRSLRKLHRQQRYRITFDQAFPEVVAACSEPRVDESGTWITPEMEGAYCDLHDAGHAHSVEVWDGDKLVGGFYGVLVGSVFCGESMFSRAPNTSKLALYALILELPQLELIDCQLVNPHLESLGAEAISRSDFLHQLSSFRDVSLCWPSTLATS